MDTNTSFKLRELHTSCKNCLFAKYDGNTQNGCSAGKLDSYINKGVEVVPAFDDEKEFFLINDKQCMLYRRQDNWDHDSSLSQEKLLAKAREETQIKYQVVLTCLNDSLDDLQTTVDSLSNQTLRPSHVTLFKPVKGKLSQHDAIDILSNAGIKWRMQDIFAQIVNPYRYLNVLLKNASFPFLGMFYTGIDLPPTTFEQIDKFINDDMESFSALTPNSENQGMFIPYFVYKFFDATNTNQTFLEFINESCDTKPITQVVTGFPE